MCQVTWGYYLCGHSSICRIDHCTEAPNVQLGAPSSFAQCPAPWKHDSYDTEKIKSLCSACRETGVSLPRLRSKTSSRRDPVQSALKPPGVQLKVAIRECQAALDNIYITHAKHMHESIDTLSLQLMECEDRYRKLGALYYQKGYLVRLSPRLSSETWSFISEALEDFVPRLQDRDIASRWQDIGELVHLGLHILRDHAPGEPRHESIPVVSNLVRRGFSIIREMITRLDDLDQAVNYANDVYDEYRALDWDFRESLGGRDAALWRWIQSLPEFRKASEIGMGLAQLESFLRVEEGFVKEEQEDPSGDEYSYVGSDVSAAMRERGWEYWT